MSFIRVIDESPDSLFELNEVDYGGYCWPCSICKYRDIPIEEAPCKKCGHYG